MENLLRNFFGIKDEELLNKMLEYFKLASLRDKCYPKTAHVYAMELSDSTVKIGLSDKIEARAKDIESANKVQVLRLQHTQAAPRNIAFEIENACHKAFQSYLARGKEYFNIKFEDACAELDKYADKISAANAELEKLRADNEDTLKEYEQKNQELLDRIVELEKLKPPTEPTTSLFAPKQPALFGEPQVQSPPSDFNQLEKLLNIIDKCSIIKDENLRDKLIRQAATLLFNKVF